MGAHNALCPLGWCCKRQSDALFIGIPPLTGKARPAPEEAARSPSWPWPWRSRASARRFRAFTRETQALAQGKGVPLAGKTAAKTPQLAAAGETRTSARRHRKPFAVSMGLNVRSLASVRFRASAGILHCRYSGEGTMPAEIPASCWQVYALCAAA